MLRITFYDKRGNPIQTRSNNHIYYQGTTTLTDTSTLVPDFTGVPQIALVKKRTASNAVVKVQTNMTYDHMYRVKSVDQYYNGGSVVHVAAYTYNELGQVIKKGLGYVNSTTWLQNLDMRYNIRGQLLSINNSKMKNDTGKTNGDTNDVFGMEMLYDKVDAKLSNTAYYNGKLSAVKWMSSDGAGGTSYERAFRYYYDALNRDTAAIYSERAAASTSNFTVSHGWDEDRITYDLNGNIKTMYRNASTQGAGTHTTIDNLTYSYSGTNNNQLTSVADASSNSAGFLGGTGGTYTYDGNGNQLKDLYKGISAIAYNDLNKTDKISFSVSVNRYIDYSYDADGNLLRKRQYDNVSGVLTLKNTTDYLDGFIYTTQTGSQKLLYFAMPEGRVVVSSSTFTPIYTITDQQGNVRMEFDNTGTGGALKVQQENSYYAFGLIMPGSVIGTPTNDNKHLYNGGSEWQNDYSNLPDYYQTYYRNYDAALARWIGADPKSDYSESKSTYNYAGNNPIMYNDPLGDLIEPPGQHNAGMNYVASGPTTGSYDEFAGMTAMINSMNDAGSAAFGLYYGNPQAYFDSYNATNGGFGGTNIYHKGNGTTSDPSTGSLAAASGLINSVVTSAGGKAPISATGIEVLLDKETTDILKQYAVPGLSTGAHFFYATAAKASDGQTVFTVEPGEIKEYSGVLTDMSAVFDAQIKKTENWFSTLRSILRAQDKGWYDTQRAFMRNVGTGMPFDLKNKPSYDARRIGTFSMYHGMVFRFDDYGNYNFGVAAKAFDYSVEWALVGAGFAQVWSGGGVITNNEGWFDKPQDTRLIIAGYYKMFTH